ncbi:hypothetical protein [Pseudoxanthomonas sp. UTMC 1351]|uniref:hypothetical protein n=1 Tax=Pseudoxanthomonas sp. UTMC 1351 TaxID=2695853 RepID=UPI0034CE4AED
MAAVSCARRSMGALSVVIAVALAVCAVDADACSIGSGIREQDLKRSYESSDEVFVARLTSYRVVAPPAGGKYMLRQLDYELIEAVKGQPASYGVLTEFDPYAPLPGNPPGIACGPWLISPHSEGAIALVMTRAYSQGGLDYVGIDPFSSRLDPTAGSADDDLELILRIHQQSQGIGP